MTTPIPTWAAQRACDLANAETGTTQRWTIASIPYHAPLAAHARYIAEHEQEPVDPVEAVIDVVAAEFQILGCDGKIHPIRTDVFRAALRRGIEIGSGK